MAEPTSPAEGLQAAVTYFSLFFIIIHALCLSTVKIAPADQHDKLTAIAASLSPAVEFRYAPLQRP